MTSRGIVHLDNLQKDISEGWFELTLPKLIIVRGILPSLCLANAQNIISENVLSRFLLLGQMILILFANGAYFYTIFVILKLNRKVFHD